MSFFFFLNGVIVMLQLQVFCVIRLLPKELLFIVDLENTLIVNATTEKGLKVSTVLILHMNFGRLFILIF